MNFGKADDLTGAIRSAAVLYKDDLSGADLIQEQISKAITNKKISFPTICNRLIHHSQSH